MHRSIQIFITVTLLSAWPGCTPSLEPLEAEVMAIHDEVMPLMSDMQSMRVQLKTAMNGLDSVEQIPYILAVNELQKGEDMMWDWMNQYRKPDLASDTARSYLNIQKEAIEEVSRQMKDAIQLARQHIR